MLILNDDDNGPSPKKMKASHSVASSSARMSSASIFLTAPDSDDDEAVEDTTAMATEDEDGKPYIDELSAYLAMEKIDNEDDYSGIEWWRKNEHLFPNLSVMARQCLGTPSTSATVERLFSHVGNTFSKKRKSLLPKVIQNIAFTKMNGV